MVEKGSLQRWSAKRCARRSWRGNVSTQYQCVRDKRRRTDEQLEKSGGFFLAPSMMLRSTKFLAPLYIVLRGMHSRKDFMDIVIETDFICEVRETSVRC
eukprot:scaffold13593_cov189-Alexandrium_tamarense.AAC.13